MDGTRLSQGEFKTLIDRMNKKDYSPQDIPYQAGNLDRKRHEAMMNAGVGDSKIMAFDRDIYHGTADKNADQKIPKEFFEEVYRTLQTPERIYENKNPKRRQLGREFHFVKGTNDGKAIKIVLRQKLPTTALRLVTMAWIADQYQGGQFEKIW